MWVEVTFSSLVSLAWGPLSTMQWDFSALYSSLSVRVIIKYVKAVFANMGLLKVPPFNNCGTSKTQPVQIALFFLAASALGVCYSLFIGANLLKEEVFI